MFTIFVNTFLEFVTSDFEKKNVNISMGVSLLEEQNWYYRYHLGKILLMYW